jgi:DNA-binding response OmpR family regulator
MADVKRILVVDDHFEMLEFLRSMLELSSVDCEVFAVPSAEEGLLELRRVKLDLLITDVRLPGMSGFDLVRRMQRMGRSVPVIMITAYASAQGRKEAGELGVFEYFQKPLDSDRVLTAVQRALFGEGGAVLKTAVAQPATKVVDVTVELKNRLETLRVDTGALHMLLATSEGQILHAVGSGPNLDYEKLAAIVARNLQDSFLLAQELRTNKPFSLQYHAGDRLELYCANIGPNFFLTMFFDATARRGRIGTIWVFTLRAIQDLSVLLAKTGVTSTSFTAAARSAPTSVPAAKPSQPAREKAAPPPVEEPEEVELVPATDIPLGISIIGQGEPAAAVVEEEEEENFLDIAPSELQAILAGGDKSASDADDLDAFWDDAVSFEDTSDAPMSLEDAMKRGLLSGNNNILDSK